MSRCIFSAIALLSLCKFGNCEFSFSPRKTEAIELWDVKNVDMFSDDRGPGRTQAYLLTSASADVGSNSPQADLFVASLSNRIYPAVTYAYFDAKADYTLTRSSSSFQIADAPYGTPSATSITTLWSKLFQFADVDKDGVYTEGVDGIVNEYSFVDTELLEYAVPKPEWDSGEFSSDDAKRTMKIKTKDGVFAVTLTANAEVFTTPGGSTITPMNAKVDVEINYNSYKELHAGNLVGLEAYVITTRECDFTLPNGTVLGEYCTGSFPQPRSSSGLGLGPGLYVEQKGNHSRLGYSWDSKATSVSDGTPMEVNVVSRHIELVWPNATHRGVNPLNEIEYSDYFVDAMGITGATTTKVEVLNLNFTFNQGKAGNVKMYQGVGIVPDDNDDNLLSGASHVARWAIILLAIFLPAASILLNTTH